MEGFDWMSLYKVIGPCVGIAFIYYWFTRNRDKEVQEAEPVAVSEIETQNQTPNMSNIYEGLNKNQFLERVMKNVGCHINMCKIENNEFHVTYQGEHFTIVYSEDSPYISVYDVAWYSAELDDIDNLSLVRQAVNASNLQNIATVLYTIDKENACVNVHTRQCCIFGSYIPDVENYLRSLFENSFKQHHNFYRHIEEIRKEQHV